MRLLNTETFELELFMSEEKPPYAILSHTWESEEITFVDVEQGRRHLLASPKKGLRKIRKSARQAQKDDLKYIWIDTCCIDKTSSAELSEAINSMFNWYRDSAVCYAFLADYIIYTASHSYSNIPYENMFIFDNSRWFTRGWTLQELIAPEVVNFYDSSWTKFGTREQLAGQIASITSIDESILTRRGALREKMTLRQALDDCSTSKKMMWASNRTTTRTEDIAYCLLGIFDINMPLLYGEGERAFQRLQEQIAAATHDQTLLAWQDNDTPRRLGIFAPHPSYFREGGRFRPVASISESFFMSKTNIGLELDVYLSKCTVPEIIRSESRQDFVAVLSCSDEKDDFLCVGLLLHKTAFMPNSYDFTVTYLPHVRGPMLIRPDANTAALPADLTYLNDRSEFLGRKLGHIEFNPMELKPHKILLHIEQKAGYGMSAIDCPRATYVYPLGLHHFYVGRIAPVDGQLSPASWEALPAMLPGPGAEYVYGAASYCDERNDGFFLMWGFFPRPGDLVDAYSERDWWISNNSVPFCEIFRADSDPLLRDPSLEGPDWVRKLVMLAAEQGDIISFSGYKETAGEARRTWINAKKEIVNVKASLKRVKFLGRHKCEIRVNIEVK